MTAMVADCAAYVNTPRVAPCPEEIKFQDRVKEASGIASWGIIMPFYPFKTTTS
jgi:hypothetical protein